MLIRIEEDFLYVWISVDFDVEESVLVFVLSGNISSVDNFFFKDSGSKSLGIINKC